MSTDITLSPKDFEKLRGQALKRWQEWVNSLTTAIAPGTYKVTIKSLGPIELFALHGSDKRIFVVTDNDWVLLLNEEVFEPFVSRHDIRPGMQLEVTVGDPNVSFTPPIKLRFEIMNAAVV